MPSKKGTLQLAIDLGSTRTKMVLLQPKAQQIAEPLAYLSFNAGNAPEETEDAAADLLSIHGYSWHQIGSIHTTGINKNTLASHIHKIPVTYTEEIRAIGLGGLALAGLPKALVVNMGTGTTFVYADAVKKTCTHVGGSGLGGGSLQGIANQIFGHMDVAAFIQLAQQGDLNRIDLKAKDFDPQGYANFPPELTIANLGKVGNKKYSEALRETAKEDMAAGLMNLTLEVIGTMALLACKSCENPPVVFTGNLSSLPQLENVRQMFKRVYGMQSVVPEDAVYATAIGATL